MVSDKLLPKFSQNLLEILDDDEYYDITIEVGNDPFVKIFRAHMVILHYRSPYLRRILSTEKKKNDGILVHIKLPNILPEIFQVILKYIYSGRISLEEHDTSDIIKILVAAGELSLQELITYLQSFLIVNKANWIEQNFNLIYQTSFENDSLSELQKYCNDLISKEPDKILKSLNLSSTPERLLVSLIQDNKLRASEIQIWEHVLKWGLAQNPELPSDPEEFSKEDFNVLKNSLQRCIQYIKFYNFTSDEFSDKVLPYKKILPKELYKDLLKYFLNSDNRPMKKPEPEPKEVKENNPKNLDSKIIKSQHVELISKWIDKVEIINDSNTFTSVISKLVYKDTKDTTMYKSNTLREFKLLFRGSRDGFTPEKFHKVCDNQSHTVMVVKVKDSNEILGGYNPIAWKSDLRLCATKDSFIFSFKNQDNTENHILSRVSTEEVAINNNPGLGPTFGTTDLILSGRSGGCVKCDYEKSIRETKELTFIVEDYEVFQVIR